MTVQTHRKIRKIFTRASQIRGRLARRRYLKKACDGCDELLAEVESLLRWHDQNDGFLATGFSLAGKMLLHYQIIENIGQGTTSMVYRVWDTCLKRFAVLKVLPPVLAADAAYARRFQREAQCAAAVSHPNVVTIYGVGQDRGTKFIVMEYVPGKRLDELIPTRGLPLATGLHYAIQIAQALAKIHSAKIIHRDLKPANILVTPEDAIRIVDFGLAKLLAGRCDRLKKITQDGTILGTVGYLSPEQVRGRRADTRSDVFAFGAIFYELLMGRRAFHGDSVLETMNAVLQNDLPKLPHRVPWNIAEIVRRCLEKNPNARFQTGQELLTQLTRLSVHTETVPNTRPSTAARRP